MAKRLDVDEYQEVVRSWRLRDMLIWMEERRVQSAFDDLKDER